MNIHNSKHKTLGQGTSCEFHVLKLYSYFMNSHTPYLAAINVVTSTP